MARAHGMPQPSVTFLPSQSTSSQRRKESHTPKNRREEQPEARRSDVSSHEARGNKHVSPTHMAEPPAAPLPPGAPSSVKLGQTRDWNHIPGSLELWFHRHCEHRVPSHPEPWSMAHDKGSRVTQG